MLAKATQVVTVLHIPVQIDQCTQFNCMLGVWNVREHSILIHMYSIMHKEWNNHGCNVQCTHVVRNALCL